VLVRVFVLMGRPVREEGSASADGEKGRISVRMRARE
jgi:hypothetical protein